MMATILKFVIVFVLGFGALLGAVSVYDSCRSDPEPLLMTAEHVQPWPFRMDSVEISCCYVRSVTILVPGNGRSYSFKGGRFADRFPVTLIGKEGLTLDDFEPARAAAEELARERWPEVFE